MSIETLALGGEVNSLTYPMRDRYGYPIQAPTLSRTGIRFGGEHIYTYTTSRSERVVSEKEEIIGDDLARRHRHTVMEIKCHPTLVPWDHIFALPGDTKRKVISRVETRWGEDTIYEIPATLHNLKKFITLPFIRTEHYAEALEWINWYMHTSSVCLDFISRKPLTTPLYPNSEDSHLVPATFHKERVAVGVRDLTAKEKRSIAQGLGGPTKEERTIWEDKEIPTPIFTHWYTYAHEYVPFSQQVLGAEYLYRVKRLPLWFDMRTGKTLLTQMVANRLLAEGEIDFVVVACPRGIMYDPWVKESIKQKFEVRVLDGTLEDDRESIYEFVAGEPGNRPTMFIINYERIASRREVLAQLDPSRGMLICDETSAVKNPGSARTKGLHEWADYFEYVAALNGTPGEQGPEDTWAQFRIVDRYGIKWGATFGQHEDQYLQKVGNKYAPLNRQQYYTLIATSSIRTTRGEADQFSGKDKAFRYIMLKGTKQIIEQTKNIINASLVELSDGSVHEVPKNVLARYTMLRQTACGYDSYRELEGGPYLRSRHEVDPKLLWIRCFIESSPTEPLVVFCEFSEQEERLKEMLDEMGISWASTRTKGRRGALCYRLKEKVDPAHLEMCRTRVKLVRSEQLAAVEKGELEMDEVHFLPERDEHYRYHPVAVEYFRNQFPWEVETYYGFEPGKKIDPRRRAQEYERFNSGQAHVIIMKNVEARGMSLSRLDAVKMGIGTFPSIVILAPTWSLGTWLQELDRCVCVDPVTKRCPTTMVYALGIRGSIEEKVYNALRSKKDVQDELLQDQGRKGFQALFEDLGKSIDEEGEGEDYFNTEEMTARIVCGVPPGSKLTEKLIQNKLYDKYGDRFKTRKEFFNWLGEPSDEKWAALAYDKDGALILQVDASLGQRDTILASYSLLLSRVKKEAS